MAFSLSIKEDRYSLNDLLDFLEQTLDSIDIKFQQISHAAQTGIAPSDPRFHGMSLNEISDYFKQLSDEAKLSYILHFVANTEVVFYLDFLERAKKGKRRIPFNKIFREIFQKSNNIQDINFNKDILAKWEKRNGTPKGTNGKINLYRSMRELRHWVAHGRFWVDYEEFEPFDVHLVCNDLNNLVASTPINVP